MINDQLFGSSVALPRPNAAITPLSLCPGTVPLVLLPVRLETRFFSLPNNVTELRVRIYPDKIHVDTHEPELTTAERTLGTQYWQQDWMAGNDSIARANAWRALADRFGAARAAWIARVMQPTNIQDRPITPVPSGQQATVAPVFPTLPPVGEHGESAWRRAPQARLLPDRWVAYLHSAGQVVLSVTGKDIQLPLALGPDPDPDLAPDAQTEAAIAAGDAMAIDPGMKWIIDFDAAESAGMALRMTVPATALTVGIDSLVVFGVAASLDPANSSSQLADLLDAHHYTDGLEFLRYGTPTNNTDDRRAGYSSEDSAHERSFGNEVNADPTNAPNATRVGAALGLDPARIAPTLGRLGQAGQDHDRDLRSMNTALWQVGWGYFLTNMIGAETGLTTTAVDWARGHFVNHVRGAGPFPALRCGPQPYGILPVTSLDLWSPDPNDDDAARGSWLKNLLKNARESLWRPALGRVARIGLRQSPPDPDADLADVMRTDAVSHDYVSRRVLGRHYLEHLFAIGAQDFSSAANAQASVAARMVATLGLPPLPAQHPRVARTFLSTGTAAITAPLVQAGEVSPWQMLDRNYIRELLTERNIDKLIAARPDPRATDRSISLLEVLLRHALLREIANAAARIAAPATGNTLATLLRDLELVDLVSPAPDKNTLQPPTTTLHWKRQLDLMVPGGTIRIREFLETVSDFSAPAVSALGEVRASLDHLQGLDTENLQCLTRSTLDLSSHRLDAWVTSFATKRLALMRGARAVGQVVGAYGWVENLKPALARAVVPTTSQPPGEQAPLFFPAKDRGFIHAPSLTHASAAALLRNAHLGPTSNPEATGPFAIDLSSQRVREASRLLDGVRQGQPLAALLGYRFERRLHEFRLDRFITRFRNIAPLVVRARESNTLPVESIAANNVVDAVVLMRRWQDASDNSIAVALQDATIGESGAITNELAALRDSIDALADALTAEAAYQMARGNPTRVATTLRAIAQGDAPPPELEVARIPRTGNAITHRVMVLFSGTSNAGGGWTNATARGVNERWLNAWIRALLGDARKVRCTVERLDDSGAVAATAAFPLTDVPISPLDFVYSVQSIGQSAQANASVSIAEQLVLYHARRMTNGFGNDAILRLQHARPTDLAAGETTLFDVLDQARAVRHLLARARGARPEDLAPPERSSKGTVDLVDLESRVVHYENALNAAHKTLASLVSRGAATLAEDFRTWILNVASFGIEPAVPLVALGDTVEIRSALARQATAMLKVSGDRLNHMTALRAQAVATDPWVRCDQLLERGRAIYGGDFVSLPRFTCDPAGVTELGAALAASTQQQGGDPLASHGWFTRTARVRDNVARLGACMRGAEVLAAGTRLNLKVAQLPFDGSERWVGLTPLPGQELPSSKLSLVVQALTPIDTTLPLSGLFVDEWVEVVPSKKETTALTFQFDPPNSFAPQNVLIAVPPVPGQDWTTETLRQVLVETLDLAKLRAVDTTLLGAAAQYLPALYVPFNVADDAVSTDFASLTA